MMTIKLLESKKDKIVLYIKDVEVPVVNALRRALMSDVPVMAIEDVYFTKNNSALYDEIIAHRLGLIPLKTDLSYKFRKDCKCKREGCSRCQVTLSLSKQGPCIVYSGDLKTSDPKIKPTISNIPIVLLLEGQELEVEAKAELGTGKQHAKWSAGLATHRFIAKIRVDNKKVAKDRKQIADACPKNILVVKGGKLLVNKKKLFDCDMCEACVKASANNQVSVEPDKSQIIFTFENWGQHPHKTAIDHALRIVADELKGLKKGLA